MGIETAQHYVQGETFAEALSDLAQAMAAAVNRTMFANHERGHDPFGKDGIRVHAIVEVKGAGLRHLRVEFNVRPEPAEGDDHADV